MSHRAPSVFGLACVLLLVLASLCRPAAVKPLQAEPSTLDGLLQVALTRAYSLLAVDPPDYPIYTDSRGTWVTAGAWYWSSGFFPGELWLVRGLSADSAWTSRAQAWTVGVEAEAHDTSTHDVGYKVGPAYMNGWRFTGSANYRSVLQTAAGSVASRWNSAVGCIRSFNTQDMTRFAVEIDNVPTLEILFWAARNGGTAAWRDMAASHALRTADEFIRPDGGSYHVVYFNPQDGTVLSKGTLQGYRDWSTWARGQAWGVYGFPMCYRETGDARLLAAARTMADYYIGRLPADRVPPWDFDVPDPAAAPKDSSATAIVAAGLLDLSRLVDSAVDRQHYRDTACAMLVSLCSPAYLSAGAASQGILLHGTYNNVTNTGVDASQIWGDYYFLQAIERYLYLSNPAGTCRVASAAWQNAPLPVRRGQFQAFFAATPNGTAIDGVVALSTGMAGAYPQCAAGIRFNSSGQIDARDGDSYRADTTLRYTAGATYQVRLSIDVSAHRYDLYITPPGSPEVHLASSYAFRTEQSGTTYLDNWALIDSIGALQVCGFRVDGSSGDINGDGYVDVFDLLILAASWGKTTGDPAFDSRCDLNSDGRVSVIDLLILADNWSK
jgi:unsaturated chondroitin disaccharide hydrolase